MKPKQIVRRFQALPLMLAGLLAATTSVAVLSNYSGLIDMSFGPDGGRIMIDGRWPLAPIQDSMGHKQV